MYKLKMVKCMNKRYSIIKKITFLLFGIIVLKLINIQVFKYDYYKEQLDVLNTKLIESDSTPRGRIYDRNGVLIVDNIARKTIYYKKNGLSDKEEIEVAHLLSELLDIDYSKLTIDNIKDSWIINNKEKINNRITEEEWNKVRLRELTNSELNKIKKSRVTDEDINIYGEEDKKIIYIYTLMNSGYYYNDKVIKNDGVTDLEYAMVGENLDSLPGIDVKLDWQREYTYGGVFRNMLGNISNGLPLNLKDKYLELGYSLNDRIGVSYIEYQYENYLRGEKAKYILNNGSITYIDKGSRGNDIVLTIDINLQREVEKILEDELIKSRYEYNTDLFNKAYAIVMEPKTGEILAMSGKYIVSTDKGYKIYDYTPGIITASVTPGSIVKGASHIVGYNNNALTIGEVRYDECIKLASTKEKCSYENLGYVNDLTALKISSNVYQFFTAINVGGGKYYYNGPLKLDPKAFDIYRNTFKQFGLGTYTKIDLPNESLGYEGDETLSGLLLDFSIGQYDTYTPIEIAQYMATIANDGVRMQPHILKAVFDSKYNTLEKVIYEFEPKELNKVVTEKRYLDRVKEGLKRVMEVGGTGYNYVDPIYEPAGKTGTAQSFLDTDGDGKIDTGTITTTFSSYAPFYDPKVVFTIICPDVAVESRSEYGISNVNKRITQKVSKKYFEIY